MGFSAKQKVLSTFHFNRHPCKYCLLERMHDTVKTERKKKQLYRTKKFMCNLKPKVKHVHLKKWT